MEFNVKVNFQCKLVNHFVFILPHHFLIINYFILFYFLKIDELLLFSIYLDYMFDQFFTGLNWMEIK